MKTRRKLTHVAALMLCFLFFTFGCGAINFVKAGEMKSESHSVDLGEATSARVQIEMDIGVLKIDGSDGKLMEGTFDYNVSDWQPQVSYTVDGAQGSLVINQPKKRANLAVQNGENHWDLRLSKGVPMDLEISTGAAVSEVNFNSIDLASLSIKTGAGKGTFDLAGSWDHDLNVTISGGVGEVTLILPREMGVRVNVDSGIGQVKAGTLSKEGDTYTNEAYGTSAHTLYVNVASTLGDVGLKLR
jgi:hypothetical protein